jgi:NADH-quinone oxidoreductase subunit M
MYNIELVNSSICSISKTMVLLTTLMYAFYILASYKNIVHSYMRYFALFLGLEFILIYLFCTNDIFIFYLLFYLLFLPLYNIIRLLWSLNLSASILFWTYTFVGSVCLILSIIWL